MNFEGRPDWDTWFMTLCVLIAQRSLDKHTKHGCIITDDSKTILSVGYNSPPRGCDDAKIPLDRPDKYDFMEHSESNAIVNAARSGTSLKNSIFYVTGRPCVDCFRKIMNVGAVRLVHGPIGHEMMGKQADIFDYFVKESNIEIIEFHDISEVTALLSQTGNYLTSKLGIKNEEKNT